MNIVVCIKQVLDTTDAKFDQESGRLKRDGQPTMINALDEHAVEEALRLKEAHGGKVTVLTMGVSSAVDALKHTVAMGADEVVHLCDEAFAGSGYVLRIALSIFVGRHQVRRRRQILRRNVE